MGVQLIVRNPNAAKSNKRVNLQARASFKLKDITIDCLVATKVNVDPSKFQKAKKKTEYFESWIKTPDGKAYTEYMENTAAAVVSYVAAGNMDISVIKKMLRGERTDNMPIYFDEFMQWVINKYKEQRDFVEGIGGNYDGDFVRQRTAKPLSKSSISLMDNTLKLIKRYCDYRKLPHVPYGEVTSDFLSKFNNWMVEGNYSANNRKQVVARIITIANIAKKKGLIPTTTELTIPSINTDRDQSAPPIHLTEERLQQLVNADMPKSLCLARDTFAIECMTGQRFSDLTKISKDKIQGDFFEIRQQKTNQIVKIPIDPRIMPILERYGGTLPKMNLGTFENKIKAIGAYLNWDEDVSVEREKNGMKYVTKEKFFALLTSHTGRRTMASLMLAAGDSLGTIAKMLGHRRETTTIKYLCLNMDEEGSILLNSEYMQKVRKINGETAI